jgi:(p)ppGpp synthase/HD superfamily hydrolase
MEIPMGEGPKPFRRGNRRTTQSFRVAITFSDLKVTFGEKIASIVLELTDDKSLPKQERKTRQIEHAATISSQAKMVKLADLICNLRNLIHSPPINWSIDRRRDYSLTVLGFLP